jgi:hypothetical protein
MHPLCETTALHETIVILTVNPTKIHTSPTTVAAAVDESTIAIPRSEIEIVIEIGAPPNVTAVPQSATTATPGRRLGTTVEEMVTTGTGTTPGENGTAITDVLAVVARHPHETTVSEIVLGNGTGTFTVDELHSHLPTGYASSRSKSKISFGKFRNGRVRRNCVSATTRRSFLFIFSNPRGFSHASVYLLAYCLHYGVFLRIFLQGPEVFDVCMHSEGCAGSGVWIYWHTWFPFSRLGRRAKSEDGGYFGAWCLPSIVPESHFRFLFSDSAGVWDVII